MPVPSTAVEILVYRKELSILLKSTIILDDAYKKLVLNSFLEINEQYFRENLENDFEFKKLLKVFVFLKIKSDEKGISKVSQCIRTDKEMHVTLYCNKYQVPIPLWFRNDVACRLTSITRLENCPSYVRAMEEKFSSSFAEELEKNSLSKTPTVTNDVLRFCLILL